MKQLDLRLCTRAFHGHIPHIVVYKTWASQEWGQILEKPHYKFTKCCWPRIVCGLLLMPTITRTLLSIYLTSHPSDAIADLTPLCPLKKEKSMVKNLNSWKVTCKVQDSFHMEGVKINNMKKNWWHPHWVNMNVKGCKRAQLTTPSPLHVHWTVLQSWVNSCFIVEPDINPSAHNNSSFDLCKHFAEIVTFEYVSAYRFKS